MKIKLITTSNHELALREIAYLLKDKAEIELYSLNPGTHYANSEPYKKQTLQEIVLSLIKEPADFYFFSVKELDRKRSFQIAEELKKRGLKTVAGGSYIMTNPQEACKYFNTLVIGEVSKQILEDILRGKEGIIYSGLNQQPTIEFYDIPLFYLENGRVKKSNDGLRPFLHPQYYYKKELSFTTMRGCSQSCSYCEVSYIKKLFPDYKIRKKPLKKVLEYVKEKVEEIKPDYIYIWDEDFLLHSEKEINEFVDEYKDIKIPFFIFATPKTVVYGKEKLEKLAKVGLHQVNIGIQSASKEIHDNLFGRRESLSEGRNAVRILTNLYKKYSNTMAPPMIDLITLNPYEGEQDILRTIKYIYNLPKPFNLIVHIMEFFNGTPLKEDAIKRGFIKKDYSFDYDLHDFISHAEDVLNKKRKNSLKNLYLSSVLFMMDGIHDGKNCGMLKREEVKKFILKYYESNLTTEEINYIIKEVERKIYCRDNSFPNV